MSVAWNRAESLSNCSKRLEATPFVSIIKSIYHRVRSFPLKSFKTQITQSVEAPSSEIMAKRHKKKNFHLITIRFGCGWIWEFILLWQRDFHLVLGWLRFNEDCFAAISADSIPGLVDPFPFKAVIALFYMTESLALPRIAVFVRFYQFFIDNKRK